MKHYVDRRARLCGECLIDVNYTKKENRKRLVSEEELEEKEHVVQLEKRVEEYMHQYSGKQTCC